MHSGSILWGHHFQNGCQQNRQIVNGLRFQWKLISRSILKWGIGWYRILIWGVAWGLLCLHPNTIKPSYGSQAKFVRHIGFALFLIIISIIIIILFIIIILIIPLFSSASILSGTFLGNRRADLFETWQKIDHHSKLCTSFLKFSKWPPFQNFKMAANNAKQFKKTQKWS